MDGKFPSPENGVSFKLRDGFFEVYAKEDEFPSPENGVSFKRSIIREVEFLFALIMFPSPENGVSFKHKYSISSSHIHSVSFRPLKTGLVSN